MDGNTVIYVVGVWRMLCVSRAVGLADEHLRTK